MLTQQICNYIFIGGAIACGVMAVVSILLFFLLRIPKVISDLSGRTAKKAIDSIRKQNEESGDKSYQSSAVNLERGKLTDKISKSGRLVPRTANNAFGTGVITEKISTQKLEGGETELLEPQGQTAVLSTAGETAVLSDQAPDVSLADQVFTVEVEITYVHTSEVITGEGCM